MSIGRVHRADDRGITRIVMFRFSDVYHRKTGCHHLLAVHCHMAVRWTFGGFPGNKKTTSGYTPDIAVFLKIQQPYRCSLVSQVK